MPPLFLFLVTFGQGSYALHIVKISIKLAVKAFVLYIARISCRVTNLLTFSVDGAITTAFGWRNQVMCGDSAINSPRQRSSFSIDYGYKPVNVIEL